MACRYRQARMRPPSTKSAWRNCVRLLHDQLRRDGIEMIAPHRANRSKPPTQDRRRLTRYMRRWLVERFFAWIQRPRRIPVRWEYYTQNFLGFAQLACLVILFRRF